MLYPTSNQPLLICLLLIAGFCCGILFDGARILNLLLGERKTTRHILDFVATLSCGLILFLVNLHFNFGQLRMYVPLLFLLSFWIERTISKKLWTNLLKKWYSNIVQRRKQGGEGEER